MPRNPGIIRKILKHLCKLLWVKAGLCREMRRRFLRVDLDNRLVATSLKSGWNAKLPALSEAEQNYERQRLADQLT
jgi:hypothetical protein